MKRIRHGAVRSVIALSVTLGGCDLLEMSPEKACTKAGAVFAKAGEDTASAKAKCVSDLTKMKKEEPKAYACTTKCLKGAERARADEAAACMSTCTTGARAASASATPDRKAPVDDLTPEDVKEKIASEYRHYGYEITGGKDNAAGWSATVALGKKGAVGELHVYKVVLVDVKNTDDGYRVVAGMKTNSVAEESRVGSKKALFVRCMFQRSATQSGAPRECGGYDSKIGSFTDDLAKL